MINTEWKNGYDTGFAAGWKAAMESNKYSYQNFPPVYYGGPQVNPTAGLRNGYVTSSSSNKFQSGYHTLGQMDTMIDSGIPSQSETKTIWNLTDHTRTV